MQLIKQCSTTDMRLLKPCPVFETIYPVMLLNLLNLHWCFLWEHAVELYIYIVSGK